MAAFLFGDKLCVPGVASGSSGPDAYNRVGIAMERRWLGEFNDENLAGRFTTQAFTLPRLSKVEDYFLRQYDASVPPRYSRHSSALHIDWPV